MNMNKQRKMHKVTKIHSLTSKTEQKKKKVTKKLEALGLEFYATMVPPLFNFISAVSEALHLILSDKSIYFKKSNYKIRFNSIRGVKAIIHPSLPWGADLLGQLPSLLLSKY